MSARNVPSEVRVEAMQLAHQAKLAYKLYQLEHRTYYMWLVRLPDGLTVPFVAPKNATIKKKGIAIMNAMLCRDYWGLLLQHEAAQALANQPPADTLH